MMIFKKEKCLLTEKIYAQLDCEGIDSKTQSPGELKTMSCPSFKAVPLSYLEKFN